MSPRLLRLERDVEARGVSAVDAFWKDLASQGSPLVEPVEGDPEHVRVTFFWRGDSTVGNVAVVSPLGGMEDFAGNQMTRLGETTVWSRSYLAPIGVRLTYELSPNDSLVSWRDVQDWDERMATWQPDPLNPRRFSYPLDDDPNSQRIVVSILEGPAAPPQPWIEPRPGVPAGQVTRVTRRSRSLGKQVGLWVYVPPGYSTSAEPYDALVLFDGLTYSTAIPTPTILDNLRADGQIPPVVALLLDTRRDRRRDLNCSSALNDFLARELLPWARSALNVSADAGRVAVGGSSLGGNAATYAALEHPDDFGAVLSQSGAFRFPMADVPDGRTLVDELSRRPRLPIRFYVDIGLLEDQPSFDSLPTPVEANRQLRSVLVGKGYPHRYSEYAGGHEPICWRGSLADGILALFGIGEPATAGG